MSTKTHDFPILRMYVTPKGMNIQLYTVIQLSTVIEYIQ